MRLCPLRNSTSMPRILIARLWAAVGVIPPLSKSCLTGHRPSWPVRSYQESGQIDSIGQCSFTVNFYYLSYHVPFLRISF